MKILKIALMVVMMTTLLVSGCVAPPDEVAERVLVLNTYTSQFAGEWKMSRVSISPEPPVPDLIIGLFLRGSPTWKITGSPDTGLASKISFDGRETWFIVPRLGISGLNIDTKPRQIAEESRKLMRSSGGGTITVERVSLIGLPEFTKVTLNYQDIIEMTLLRENEDAYAGDVKADAVLRVQVTGGTYTMDGETRSITPYPATVTYTGTRPRRP